MHISIFAKCATYCAIFKTPMWLNQNHYINKNQMLAWGVLFILYVIVDFACLTKFSDLDTSWHKPRRGFPIPYLFVLMCVQWFEDRCIFRFVGIGGIVDHLYLNFLLECVPCKESERSCICVLGKSERSCVCVLGESERSCICVLGESERPCICVLGEVRGPVFVC